MPRYEYKMFEIESGMFGSSSVPEEELNSLGDQGWDVVATVNQNSGQTKALVLQRER
jgi:hypothetical protein